MKKFLAGIVIALLLAWACGLRVHWVRVCQWQQTDSWPWNSLGDEEWQCFDESGRRMALVTHNGRAAVWTSYEFRGFGLPSEYSNRESALKHADFWLHSPQIYNRREKVTGARP